jgi:hypothetical protein
MIHPEREALEKHRLSARVGRRQLVGANAADHDRCCGGLSGK